jgi:hypothetical protein
VLFDIKRPSPVPVDIPAESIPVPVSVILTITSSRSIFDTAATVTVPSFVNLATLLKFEMT